MTTEQELRALVTGVLTKLSTLNDAVTYLAAAGKQLAGA